jgi:hypothetical protein
LVRYLSNVRTRVRERRRNLRYNTRSVSDLSNDHCRDAKIRVSTSMRRPRTVPIAIPLHSFANRRSLKKDRLIPVSNKKIEKDCYSRLLYFSRRGSGAEPKRRGPLIPTRAVGTSGITPLAEVAVQVAQARKRIFR